MTSNSFHSFLYKNRIYLYICLAFHLLAAFLSEGFLHWDEHFQLLEFANFKLGRTPLEHLPWEYSSLMRPFLWPWIFTGFIHVLEFLHISSPFVITTLFRIFAMILSLGCLYCITRYFWAQIKESSAQKLLIILSTTLWFLPYIHVRLSAEAIGSSLFFFGFVLAILDTQKLKRYAFLAGILMGLSWITRYHFGIMVFFYVIWSLLIGKEKFSRHLILLLGVLVITLLSVLIDYWGTGQWHFAPWNYLIQNIFHNKAANYGTSPWYDYFKQINKKAIAPFGILIILSYLWYWIRKPKDLITWISLPFFLIHMVIGHKEFRFLFPLAPLIPFVCTEAFSALIKRVPDLLSKKWFIRITKFVFGVNLLLLLVASTKPAHKSVPFFRFLANHEFKTKEFFYVGEINPFYLAKLHIHFYQTKEISFKKWEPELAPSETHYIFFSKLKDRKQINAPDCNLIYLGIPKWLTKIQVGRWQERSKVWGLLECPQKN